MSDVADDSTESSREVIAAMFSGELPSRVGLKDGPWPDTLRKWVSQGYPADEKGEPVSPEDHFGFDMVCVGGWFDILPLAGHEEIIEETDEWVLKKNGAGAVLRWWKHKSGTPEHVDFTMTSREVWDRDYRPHLLEVNPKRVDLEDIRSRLRRATRAGRWTFYANMFVWENMRASMGDVTLYQSVLLDPDWIHDYCRVYTDFFKAHYELLFKEVGLPDGIWMFEDLGYANGLLCSPKVYGDLIFPYYGEMVDFFHDRGLPVVLHSCGGIGEALPLVVEAGFDGLNPMEVKAGCDTLEFARRYGDEFVFIGGLDARVLESGDRDLIRKETIRLVEGMKSLGARYVFGSDHSLSTNVDYDDFKYAVQVYREHMMY